MWHDTDINKPTEFHMKLLAKPDFDFAPFWEEAVVNWLHRNSSRLLQVNPQCCKHYIGDREQKFTIANHIPMDNDEDIVEFMRSLEPIDTREFDDLALRLATAGKADLVLKGKLQVFFAMEKEGDEEDASKILAAMSDTAIEEVLDRMMWDQCKWDDAAFTVIVKRLPTARLKDVKIEKLAPIMRSSRTYGVEDTPIHKTRNRTAHLLASLLPKEHLRNFLARLTPVISIMDCMSCGEFTAKSKPGYTLHRKVCDPRDEFPNALVTAASRLL